MVCTKTSRLLSMLVLTLSFFFVEIVFGYMSNSVALIADSFHMLSDVVALIIAFVSVRISKHQSKKNTFGWARAEVLGALINSAFLLALSFSIFVEALKRLVSAEEVHNPVEVLVVGSVGLVVNILGLFLFHGHSHGHSHGHHEHTVEAENPSATIAASLPRDAAAAHRHRLPGDNQLTQQQEFNEHHVHSDEVPLTKHSMSRNASVVSHDDLVVHRHSASPPVWPHSEHASHRQDAVSSPTSFTEQHTLQNGTGHNFHPPHNHDHDHNHNHGVAGNRSQAAHSHSHDLNMHAAFLHVLGDAIGSIVVIISALVIWLTDWSIRTYIDPILSIVLVGIIIFTTVPVLRESAHVLLQTVPVHIQVDELRRKLIGSFPEIYSVHELHIWQLTGNKIIASAHIQCPSQGDYMQLAKRIKTFFHNEGIHSTTIQPEFALGYGLKGAKSLPAFEINNRISTANAGGDAYADDASSVPFTAPATTETPEIPCEMASGNPISGIRTAICGEPKPESEVILNTCALTCPTGSVCNEDMCCDPNASQRPMTPPARGKTMPADDGVPRKRNRLLKMFSRSAANNNDEAGVVLSSDVHSGQRRQSDQGTTVVI